jgi:hypothetical protein
MNSLLHVDWGVQIGASKLYVPNTKASMTFVGIYDSAHGGAV